MQLDEFKKAVNFTKVNGIMHGINIPPYPPNQYGMSFGPDTFGGWIQTAELLLRGFDFFNPFEIPVYAILFKALHEFEANETSLADFMNGEEPEEEEEGWEIYKYLIASVSPNSGFLSPLMFLANLQSNGNAEDFLAAFFGAQEQAQGPDEPLVLYEAMTLADALPMVSAPSDIEQCAVCWNDFEEGRDSGNDEPIQLPCNPRHIIGRNCLIELFSITGRRCPICRIDIVTLAQITGVWSRNISPVAPPVFHVV